MSNIYCNSSFLTRHYYDTTPDGSRFCSLFSHIKPENISVNIEEEKKYIRKCFIVFHACDLIKILSRLITHFFEFDTFVSRFFPNIFLFSMCVISLVLFTSSSSSSLLLTMTRRHHSHDVVVGWKEERKRKIESKNKTNTSGRASRNKIYVSLLNFWTVFLIHSFAHNLWHET